MPISLFSRSLCRTERRGYAEPLLVEDHAPMRATLRMWLADLAAPITECDNGLDVCSCYAAHHPDWVLMDIDLPGQDGITATRELLTAHRAACVLIVTA